MNSKKPSTYVNFDHGSFNVRRKTGRSVGLCEGSRAMCGQKRCTKNGAEFISASVALLSHIYNIPPACLAQTVHDGKPETDRTRALGEE